MENDKLLFRIEENTKTGDVTIGNETGTVTLTKEQADCLKKPHTVTLTNEECHTLTMYLLLTANFRKSERDEYYALAKETNKDGTVIFEHAQSNGDYWADMCKKMENLLCILNER